MKKVSVLIIEDDEWLAELFSSTIKNSGYEPYIAHNVVEAIEAIDSGLPSVIVLDMLLTGSTALVLLHELKTYQDTSSIPVILCTNMADDISIDDLSSYGVKRILDKTTMHPSDIISSIRALV